MGGAFGKQRKARASVGKASKSNNLLISDSDKHIKGQQVAPPVSNFTASNQHAQQSDDHNFKLHQHIGQSFVSPDTSCDPNRSLITEALDIVSLSEPIGQLCKPGDIGENNKEKKQILENLHTTEDREIIKHEQVIHNADLGKGKQEEIKVCNMHKAQDEVEVDKLSKREIAKSGNSSDQLLMETEHAFAYNSYKIIMQQSAAIDKQENVLEDVELCQANNHKLLVNENVCKEQEKVAEYQRLYNNKDQRKTLTLNDSFEEKMDDNPHFEASLKELLKDTVAIKEGENFENTSASLLSEKLPTDDSQSNQNKHIERIGVLQSDYQHFSHSLNSNYGLQSDCVDNTQICHINREKEENTKICKIPDLLNLGDILSYKEAMICSTGINDKCIRTMAIQQENSIDVTECVSSMTETGNMQLQLNLDIANADKLSETGENFDQLTDGGNIIHDDMYRNDDMKIESFQGISRMGSIDSGILGIRKTSMNSTEENTETLATTDESSQLMTNRVYKLVDNERNLLHGIDSKRIYDILGERIRSGKLVVFPTETVYGLGCNSLDEQAILSVFKVKKRPLNDPLISHVLNIEHALKTILDVPDGSIEHQVIVHIAETFWPGSLSIAGKARINIPTQLSANTGTVAVRCPANVHAIELIKAAGVPIAAPSANKFGHISPTKVSHVINEFLDEDIVIIDGGQCDIGVESTVIEVKVDRDDISKKDDESHISICIHRRGYITKQDIEKCLHNQSHLTGKAFPNIKVFVSPKIDFSTVDQGNTSSAALNTPCNTEGCEKEVRNGNNLSCSTRSDRKDSNDLLVECGKMEESTYPSMDPLESPGMLLAHYSPYVVTHFVRFWPKNRNSSGNRRNRNFNSKNGNLKKHGFVHNGSPLLKSSLCVLIDIDGRLSRFKSSFLHYINLLDTLSKRSILVGINKVFDVLHCAESSAIKEGAEAILITHFDTRSLHPLAEVLYDRLYRAAAGVIINAVEEDCGLLKIYK